MTKSESIQALAAALAKAQPQIEGASKDKNNPAFRSKYADLASVSEAIGPAIAAHGLSYVQVSHDRENAACIETVILHSSGEWMGCGPFAVPVTKHDAHGYGSALTYARRYSLSAAFGVVPEDDDGNAAAKSAPAHAANRAGDNPDARNSATNGYWEAMTVDMQNVMLDTAHRVSSLLKKGDTKGAAAELMEATDKFDGREDFMSAQWTRFEKGERSLLKANGFHFNTQKAAA